jgi:hypothetical protein
MRSRSLARAFYQKHMEVRGRGLGVKLPHHYCYLTSMVGGMVRQMLHQMRQLDLRSAKRKHFLQGLVCHTIHELGLFFLDLRPLYLHRSEARKCIRIEQEFASRSQIRQEGGALGRLLPLRKPAPFAADDVHERVSHGTKAAAHITGELFSAERGDRVQNSVVRPAVVFVEQPDVIFSHGGGCPTPFVRGILPCPPGIRQNPRCGDYRRLEVCFQKFIDDA